MEVAAGARAESALLAAVIARAVNDCCYSWAEADTAMRFLMDRKGGGLASYTHWLGCDAEQFRQKLLTMMRDERSDVTIIGRTVPAPGCQFKLRERRQFMRNLRALADAGVTR